MSLDTQRPSYPRPRGKIGAGAGSLQAARKITTSAVSPATGTRRMLACELQGVRRWRMLVRSS
jgi:hypothetical protein